MAKPIHNTVTRRAALAGTAAGAVAIAAGSVPALAGEHPDAEIFELARQFDAIEAELAEAEDRCEAAFERYRAAMPDMPDALKIRPEDAALRMPRVPQVLLNTERYGFPEVQVLREQPRIREIKVPIRAKNGAPLEGAPQFFAPGEDIGQFLQDHVFLVRGEHWPEAQARADEIIAAFDGYDAKQDELLDALGCTASEEEVDAISERLRDVRETVFDRRAVTFEGMAVKVRLALRMPRRTLTGS